MTHKHTTSFQDWPCNLCKFYKTQGTLVDERLICLFLNSFWQVEEEVSSAIRLTCISGQKVLSACPPLGEKIYYVSLSINSHSDIPSHSQDPLHPVEKSRASSRGLLRQLSLRPHKAPRGTVLRWNVPPHEWNTILILTQSVIFIPRVFEERIPLT